MRRRLSQARALSSRLGAAVLTVVLVAAVAPMARAATACRVTYQVSSQWPGGFTANITITNLGDPLNGWRLEFQFPNASQRVTQGWSATWSQNGQNVTATSMSWNANLGTNQSTSIGFNGAWSGSNPVPTSFTINGVTCNGASNQPPTVAITSPQSGATFTAPASITINATASDSDGSIARVEFYNGSTLLGSDTSSPYSFTWTNVPAGNYSLTARAFDNAGASTTSSPPVLVTVAQPPAGPSVVASTDTVSVPEGGTASFTIRLSQQPSASVTVTVARTAGDTDITVQGSATRTFTTANWNTPQTVTLAAAEDTDSTNGNATITASASGHTSAVVTAVEADNDQSDYAQRFLALYNKIKDPANGYFSQHGIPYHSVETLIVEAPDYGHVTTSEAFSYLIWLEAVYGQVTGDWTRFNNAWSLMERYIIPAQQDQPTNSFYNPSSPATYAPEWDEPNQYPSQLDSSVQAGQDPLANELQSTYGTRDIYGMHWLLDVDNRYGYGRCGDGTTSPSYINTFQRGPQESVWETVPHPSCETFDFGGPNGFLDLFIRDSGYARQWRYTNAPDADARAVQAAYWALQWATAQGRQSQISSTIAKAARMGDYLRYSFFDKYFKRIGNCVGAQQCPAGSGKNSAHYLLSWYYAWGGALDSSAGWAWRIGSSHAHFGYQNPLAAWALANVTQLRPQSPTAVSDWQTSLQRQLEFYRWLQSAEGAIAGGATNSWAGRYAQPPSGTPTFYGMFYDWQPVYHDPPSNQWFGFQAWSMERVAEFYYVAPDGNLKTLAGQVLQKWVNWALSETTINADGTFRFPSELAWSGQPDTWNPSSPGSNANLHVTVRSYTNDVGVAAAYAKTLLYYAAETGNTQARDVGKAILDGMWANHQDSRGIAVTEERADYNRFDDPVFIPSGWSGEMANGDPINSSSTFVSIRSWYRQDPQWSKVQTYLNGGAVPTFTYHRFWAQADIAIAMATYAQLFG